MQDVPNTGKPSNKNTRKRISRLATETDGVAAIEFALVIGPFLMLLFGILGVGLYFFTVFSLETAIEVAARQIRTRENVTVAAFKSKVCGAVPGYVLCDKSLHVSVQAFPDSAKITATSAHKCLNAGGSLNTTIPFDPGNSGNPIVLVIACYEWETAKILPFIKLGSMSNGSMLIQAATTFRIEPE